MENNKKTSSAALEKTKNNERLENLRKALHICVDCDKEKAEHRQLNKGFMCQECMDDEAYRVMSLFYCDGSFVRQENK